MFRILSSVVAAVSQLWKEKEYRPERYYMRGPGPKWREKHAIRTTMVALMTLVCAGALSLGGGIAFAQGQDSGSSFAGAGLHHCMVVNDDAARLSCYDKIVGRPPTPPAKGAFPPLLMHSTDKPRS